MTTVRLMLRRHRLLITSWSVLLIALSGATVSAYQATYSSPEQRRPAIELARHNAASTLLYGELADPGTPAQMFTWEIGAIATVLTAIMAVLLAIALTRAAEDDGTLELLLSTGIEPRIPLRSALAVLAGVAAVLTLGCAIAVGLAVGSVDAVTWPGAVAFGSVMGLTFLVVGVLTMALSQIASTASGSRVLGFAAVGIAFGVRAFADTQHIGWLNWLSPLALRATVRPFADDRWWVLAAYLAVTAALARLSTWLSGRRDYGAGMLRRRELSDARLNVRSGFGLVTRLSRASVLTWTVAVACIGALFSAIGSGAVEQSRRGDLGGFLGAQIGSGDPVAAYFAYCGTVVGMVVTVFAVLSILRVRHDETEGLTDHVLATGVRRWQPLMWQVTATAVGSAVILLATGALSALLAPTAVHGPDVAARAFAYPVGQWPAAMAAAGWTALLVGWWPRYMWPAWVPLVASGTLVLLGRLLGIPQPIREHGLFQHVPDPASASPDVRGLGVLLVLCAAACLLAAAGIVRRDVTTG